MNGVVRRDQRGFTLIELMIGMLLGLIILGGVLTIYSSVHHTSLIKQRLDSAQEAVRYGHYTISRLVHNADEFANGSDADTLVLGYPSSISNVDGCTGGAISGTTSTAFSTLNGRLRCDGNDIALGVDDIDFEYGIVNDSGNWQITAAADATSVKVTLTIQPHEDFAERDVTFIATMRNAILAKDNG